MDDGMDVALSLLVKIVPDVMICEGEMAFKYVLISTLPPALPRVRLPE